jgi:hypothetical protein
LCEIGRELGLGERPNANTVAIKSFDHIAGQPNDVIVESLGETFIQRAGTSAALTRFFTSSVLVISTSCPFRMPYAFLSDAPFAHPADRIDAGPDQTQGFEVVQRALYFREFAHCGGHFRICGIHVTARQ